MSLRVRITAIATVILLVVLTAAAVIIITLAGDQIGSDLADQTTETRERIVSEIEAGIDPTSISLPIGADGTNFRIETADGGFVNGTLAADALRDELPDPFDGVGIELDPDSIDFEAELEALGLEGAEVVGVTEIPTNEDGSINSFGGFSEVATAATAPSGDEFNVISVSTTNFVDRSVTQVRTVLLWAIPFLGLIFAGVLWVVVSRTLKPVDDIVATARQIQGDTLHERIDSPETNDEISRLADTLNSMLERLEQNARDQEQFVSDASHELRSPLTVLLGEAQLALESDDPARHREAHELVVEHGQSMSVLIDDLLELARSGGSALHRVDIDLDDLITDQARRHLMDVDVSAVQHVRIVGDERSLGRVIRNLLDNACKFADGVVQASCELVGTNAVIRIDDDGPGIPTELRETIFERFKRVDEARARSVGGTGLGLAIAKAIVEQHDGTITIHDSPLGGARMEIILPASAA